MADTSHLSVAQMRENASEATAMLLLLAHEDRLLLLCQLSQEELCVSDLDTLLAIRQPTLSQQLGVLRREELVATRRQGKHIYYRIADESVLALLQTLYELYCQPQGEIS